MLRRGVTLSRSSEDRYVRGAMTAKKTLLIAIASWALPLLSLVCAPIAAALFPATDAETEAGVMLYMIGYAILQVGSPAIACVLAIVARRSARRPESRAAYRHATVGLVASVPLLLWFAGMYVFAAMT